jgi:hypothetical protein
MTDEQRRLLRDDPVGFLKFFWPLERFYNKQVEALESVRDNHETIVVAGHQLGKDYLAGFCALWWFLTRHPCRVVTTSVKDDHLRVLWGEIGRFIDTARLPLSSKRGGMLAVNHREIRKYQDGVLCKISYLIGQVSEKGEGMAGHHAANTLLIIDEASGADDLVYERGSTWAKRILVIGNPYTANNFFYRGVKGGDLLARA